MQAYLDILKDIVENGDPVGNRTGEPTRYKFATRFRHDLRNGFPLLTTKKVNLAKVAGEIFGFLRGATHVDVFHELECNIWDDWALEHDFKKIMPRTRDEVIEAIAEKLSISTEEASDAYIEVVNKYDNYNRELNELITTGDEVRVQAHMASAPPTVSEWLHELDVNTYKSVLICPKGELGPIYGKQWIDWTTPDGRSINQIKNVVRQLKETPESRRIIIGGWNPADISDERSVEAPDGQLIKSSKDRVKASIQEGKMALPPCHLLTIFNVNTSYEVPVLNLHQIMRSNDVPVGKPFNIAGYALLLELVAKQCGMVAGELVIDVTNAHVYANQVEGALTQLQRTPTKLPTLTVPDGIDVTDPSTLTIENLKLLVAGLEGYNPQPFIKFPVAV